MNASPFTTASKLLDDPKAIAAMRSSRPPSRGAVPAYDWISHHRAHQPSKLAVRELATQRNFSYADLDGRADALAAYLVSIGVGRGDRVTLLAHNGVSTIMYTSNAEVLKAYYRTDQITFKFDSTITHTTHSYTTPHDLINEVQLARIGGHAFSQCDD